MKIKLKRMWRIHREQLPSYLDEFMWMERQCHNIADIFKAILREIKILDEFMWMERQCHNIADIFKAILREIKIQ